MSAIPNLITGPAVISSPGVYQLQNDIINTPFNHPWDGITITSSNVEFDGMGHTIDGLMLSPGYTDIHGVYAYNGASLSNIIVKNVTVKGTWQGIDFFQVSNGRIENVSGRNNYNSIFLIYSSSNTITGCNVSEGNGIGIWPGSNSNTITNNIARDNNFGFAIYNGQDNIVTDNTFGNNIYGVVLEGSSTINNQIYRNNIFSNTGFGIQLDGYPGSPGSNAIYDNYFSNIANVNFEGPVSENTWNIPRTTGTNILGGSYLGGNYWATPSNNGFSQGCMDTNEDGICDSPYSITTGNIDNFPLASASVTVAPVASFTGIPTSGTAPLIVTFTDRSANTPTVWNWNFGDGSTSTLQNPYHTYTTAGTYTVSLIATNSAGSNVMSLSNYITVKSTSQAIQDVIDLIKSMDLPKGTENSLTSKLDNAIKSLDKGNVNATKNQLEATIKEITAQTGKNISEKQANTLIPALQNIIKDL